AGLDEGQNLLYLVVVEGRQLTYRGMTLDELADLATELKLTKAINLDGGGSSVMVVAQKRISDLPLL
ncbi:phosphodiester glycosidase family protein, partial [Tessaracoccus sp. OH4464_COT-324]|uniref:phosphodiester glycosidase family protein n=1 Tax=Tessaracoccus sp. OH4464_COT-324 TaxID=2491059 RepID=UPI000F9B8B6E